MTVHLLEKTPVGVTTKSLDIRHGKSVEDVADEAKARFVGEALIDWWQRATRWHFVMFHLGPTERISFDLRANLLRALTDRARISPAARVLSLFGAVTPLPSDPLAVGRDLLGWWAEPEGSHLTVIHGRFRSVRYDLRLGLNQSMASWQEELRRKEASVGV